MDDELRLKQIIDTVASGASMTTIFWSALGSYAE